MAPPTVAILGASNDRNKFGNISVRGHQQQGYRVFPVNPKGEPIEGLTTYRSLAEIPEPINRISVYLPPAVLRAALQEIAAVPHDELFLNPGTDTEEILTLVDQLGLEAIRACSIVNLGISPADLT